MSSRWPPERLDPQHYPGPGLDLPVIYGDLDTNRHMNNVAFGRYFEHARVDFHAGFVADAQIHERGGSFVVAHAEIDYLAEVHYGHPLHVRTAVLKLGRTSLVERQAAWWNGQCAALCDTAIVYREHGAPAPLTEPLRAALESYLFA